MFCQPHSKFRIWLKIDLHELKYICSYGFRQQIFLLQILKLNHIHENTIQTIVFEYGKFHLYKFINRVPNKCSIFLSNTKRRWVKQNIIGPPIKWNFQYQIDEDSVLKSCFSFLKFIYKALYVLVLLFLSDANKNENKINDNESIS